MSQIGHCDRKYPIYKQLIVSDYNKKSIKPCFDGEARYEDHPTCWNDILDWFNDVVVRQIAYWILVFDNRGSGFGYQGKLNN